MPARRFAYFERQGVSVRVISGDNPTTVAAVARQVGLDVGEPVERQRPRRRARRPREPVRDHVVFGRVRPEQKRSMVKALQADGHVVAMTGDGVNDALALKDADIGVAMGNGAQATKAVAELVLLDGRFAHLPDAVAEGRRVIGNVERVANLFLSKNAASFMLILLSADRRPAVPVRAPAPDAHQRPHDRHPRVLPRPRAEQRPLPAGVPRAGPALRASPPAS